MMAERIQGNVDVVARARSVLAAAEASVWASSADAELDRAGERHGSSSTRGSRTGFSTPRYPTKKSLFKGALRQSYARDVRRFLAACDAGHRGGAWPAGWQHGGVAEDTDTVGRSRKFEHVVLGHVAPGHVALHDGAVCDAEVGPSEIAPVSEAIARDTGAVLQRAEVRASVRREDLERLPMIALGDAACDAALGGGLACGALHEIQGVCFAPVAAQMGLDGAAAQGVKDVSRPDEWIVPFGCLLHVVHRALRHPSLCGLPVAWIGTRVHPPPHMLRLLGQGSLGGHEAAAREGSRSGPPCIDEEMIDRSVFIADAPLDARDASGRAVLQGQCFGEAVPRRRTGRPRGTRDAQLAEQTRVRLWCAETAIRSGAFSVIVLDARGFDRIAWRRLQLAAAAARRDAVGDLSGDIAGDAAVLEGDTGGDGFAMSGAHRCLPAPLVLAVTPAESVGVRHIQTAATRWTVRVDTVDAPVGGAARCATAASGGCHSFCWRMELAHVRAGLGGQGACRTDAVQAPDKSIEPIEPIDFLGMSGAPRSVGSTTPRLALDTRGRPEGAGSIGRFLGCEPEAHRSTGSHAIDVHAAIAGRELAVAVERPRTPFMDAAWNALRNGMAGPGQRQRSESWPTEPAQWRLGHGASSRHIASIEASMLAPLTAQPLAWCGREVRSA